jgi:hypothetical protein
MRYEDCKRQGLVCNLGPGRRLDWYVAVEKIGPVYFVDQYINS